MKNWKEKETTKKSTTKKKYFLNGQKTPNNSSWKKCQFLILITCYFIRGMCFSVKTQKKNAPQNICFTVN